MKKLLLLTFLSLLFFICLCQESVSARILADTYNDFDGDGKTDPAIFDRTGQSQPDTPAYFRVPGSQRGLFSVQWGLDTDSP